jgi:hypothetical protein
MTRPTDEWIVRVTVTRTGGFAGMKREWSAEPQTADAPRWVALIEECPWDQAPDDGAPPRGADLFVWRIRAQVLAPEEPVERDAELQDPDVTGPWQTLIDEVRTASASSASDSSAC